MKYRLIALPVLVALAAMLVLAPFSASAAPQQAPAPTQGVSVPVTGSFTDALGGLGNFTGTLDIQRFVYRNGQISAIGTLTGALTDSVGTVLGTVTQSVTLPLANISGSCQILHLELGPLDLNLLGLQVHLDRVVLDITAQSGSGNLLGNLLCAVAHLLDTNALGTALTNLLNQILGLLG